MLIQKGPYLQNPHTTDITVLWETDEPSIGEVRVYDTYCAHVPREKYPVCGEPRIYPSGCAVLHRVVADGLTPDTDYYYEVISQNGQETVVSDKFSFRTAPDRSEAISFLLTAEEGGLGEKGLVFAEPLHELMRRERADFIQSVGDIVCDGRQDDDWIRYLFTPFRKLLANTPFYPCVGNHEVGGNAVREEEIEERYANYKKYFVFPPNYSYDYGCAHFTVLDCPSMFDRIDSSGVDGYIPHLKADFADSPVVRFLEEDLAASKAVWKLVVFHYPPYTSSIYDVRELQILAPIFEKYGVDIVFNSHAIVYERSHPIRDGKICRDGVRYILVGGHGDKDVWFRDKCSRRTAKIAARPNYVRVALTPLSLELQAIDCEGRLFDAFTIDK